MCTCVLACKCLCVSVCLCVRISVYVCVRALPVGLRLHTEGLSYLCSVCPVLPSPLPETVVPFQFSFPVFQYFSDYGIFFSLSGCFYILVSMLSGWNPADTNSIDYWLFKGKVVKQKTEILRQNVSGR